MMITKKWVLIGFMIFIPTLVSARTIQSTEYIVWGIGSGQIAIPTGSVITEAVLTIQNITSQGTPLYIHLLDDAEKGLQVGTDEGPGDFFESYGILLSGVYENGNYVCRFSQNENSQSPLRAIYPNPTTVTLAGSTTVQLSSALLELMDYIGNGNGLGIGIDSDGAVVQYSNVVLDLSIKAYSRTGNNTKRLFYFEDHALQFDGMDDYVALNSAAPVNTFTVSAWVKATETHQIDTEGMTGYLSGISGQRYLFGCTRGSVADDAGMGVSVGTNGISVYEHGIAYMPAIAVYKGKLGTNWNHIAVSYTNKQARIYLNGVLVRTGLTSPKENVFAPVYLGKGTFGYGSFGGIVDNVCVLNYACAEQQIQSIMNAGPNVNEAGVIGYWTFDEGTGTATSDISENTYLAALYGTAWAEQRADHALQFDGMDDYVALNSAAPVNTFTVSAWVKATEIHQIDSEGTTGYLSGISGQRYLFGCTRGSVADDAGMGVSVGTNGISVYEHGSAYMPAIAVYEGKLGTNWNHIAVSYTNKQARIYLNGVLVRTGLTSPKENVFAPVYLGKGTFGYGSFGGIVDNVCVLNYACAEQQIQSIMNTGPNVNKAGVIGYWTFDERTGTTASDISENACLAALYGTVWVNLK